MKLSSKIIRLPMIAVLAMATPLAFAQSKAHDQNHTTTTAATQKSAHNDNSASAMVSDAAITASVKTKLMADGRTDAMDINVDTVNGQVILRGTAANNQEKMAATELAKSVDNVKGVSNQLTMSSDPKTNPQTLSAKTAAAVSSSTTTTEREEKRHDNMKHDADKSSTAAGAQMDYPDSWITTKVKSEFATTKGISATDISVTTESGKVWLSGTVKTAAEKQQAMNAAKAVKGVQSVDGSKLTVQQ